MRSARSEHHRTTAPPQVVPRDLSELPELRRHLSPGIARVDGALRLEQDRLHLLVGSRAVLDTLRNDEDVVRPQHHITIAQLDRQTPSPSSFTTLTS